MLLTSAMFVQFNTVQVIEESGVGAMRESELRSEYSELKSKSDEIEASLNEVQQSISEYQNQLTDNQGSISLLREDYNKANCD